jgi:hypothetical protein
VEKGNFNMDVAAAKKLVSEMWQTMLAFLDGIQNELGDDTDTFVGRFVGGSVIYFKMAPQFKILRAYEEWAKSPQINDYLSILSLVALRSRRAIMATGKNGKPVFHSATLKILEGIVNEFDNEIKLYQKQRDVLVQQLKDTVAERKTKNFNRVQSERDANIVRRKAMQVAGSAAPATRAAGVNNDEFPTLPSRPQQQQQQQFQAPPQQQQFQEPAGGEAFAITLQQQQQFLQFLQEQQHQFQQQQQQQFHQFLQQQQQDQQQHFH